MNSYLAARLVGADCHARSPNVERVGPFGHFDPTHRTRIGQVDGMKNVFSGTASNRSSDEDFDQDHCAIASEQPYGVGTITPYPDTNLREKQVIAVTGLGRSSIWAFGNPKSRYYDPTFPKPVKLGIRAVGWKASEVFLWVASRMPRA